jgi:hypothetical protein
LTRIARSVFFEEQSPKKPMPPKIPLEDEDIVSGEAAKKAKAVGNQVKRPTGADIGAAKNESRKTV